MSCSVKVEARMAGDPDFLGRALGAVELLLEASPHADHVVVGDSLHIEPPREGDAPVLYVAREDGPLFVEVHDHEVASFDPLVRAQVRVRKKRLDRLADEKAVPEVTAGQVHSVPVPDEYLGPAPREMRAQDKLVVELSVDGLGGQDDREHESESVRVRVAGRQPNPL